MKDDGTIEDDEVAQFVRRWVAVDGDTLPATRFLVKAGRSRRAATKAAAGILIEDGADVEKLIKTVRSRVRAAIATGERKVFLEVYDGSGDKHPVDLHEIEGDPAAMRDAATDDDSETLVAGMGAGLTALANANAAMVRGAFAELRHAYDLIGSTAGQNMELIAEAAAALQEIKVRAEVGWQRGLAESIQALAPTLKDAAPALLAIYLAHANGDDSPKEAVTPAGKLRQRCVALEREATLLAGCAVEPQVRATLQADPNLRMELRGRIGALLQAASQAFGQILAEPPPPEPEPQAA